MFAKLRRALSLLLPLTLAGTALLALSPSAQGELFDQRPGVTCVSENYPEFAEEMTDLMRIAVNVGTDVTATGVHQPGVAFYDDVTRTECYTSRSVHFETGSVIKAVILGVLLRRPEGVTDAQRPLVEKMLLTSLWSNDAALELWRGTLQCGRDDAGVPRPCTEVWDFLAAAGMSDTYLASSRAFGDTHMTAYDAVQLFKVFTRPNELISTERRRYAMDLLARTPDRYGVTSFAPPGTVQRAKIGHKKNNDDPDQWISNAVGQVHGGAEGYNYLMSIFTNWNSEAEIPLWPDTPTNGPARVDRIGRQLNCGVRELNGDHSCWNYQEEFCMITPPALPSKCSTRDPLRSHRSQHWVLFHIPAARPGFTARWQLVDAANGDVVDSGEVAGDAAPFEKTVYGLYGSYILRMETSDPQGYFVGRIANYTGDPQPPGNQRPVVHAGPDRSGLEGRPVDLTGFVNDDQGIPEFHWSASPIEDVDPGATCAFEPPNALITTVTCTDDGVFALHLSANDGTNDTVTDTARLTLRNVAPALGTARPAIATAATVEATDDGFVSPQPWQVFKVGDPVPLNLQFRDLGSNDTHTCGITWDDGQAQTIRTDNHVCQATHTYAQPGMYTIKSTVEDDDAGGVLGSVMVIVYDPDGGFATAGAHLDSPAGALASTPDAAGRLHIQLNPKYRPGDPGPAVSGGKVSARLSTASFSVDSTTLDWLVVTPAGKVAVKGTGSVNRQSGYGFIAYGYDDPDKLRLVVWRLSDGDYPSTSVVYDNRRSSDYDLDLANPQQISGGSFQAHL